MKEKTKKIVKWVLFPIFGTRYLYWKYLQIYNHKKWADILFKGAFGRHINWDAPKDMNEKQRWIQFNTEDPIMWAKLADKYEVRNYIKNKGYGDILVKLYGKWDDAKDIDFGSLPNSFVLKTTHGSGEIIIVEDKNTLDISSVRKKLNKYLHTPYGLESAEYHYLKIKPIIIAEELLTADKKLSSSIIDYKFYTFHGIPKACAVFFNRDVIKHEVSYGLYDMDWNCIENNKNHYFDSSGITIPKPKRLHEMIEICKKLASDFPFVRLDLYESNNRVYFGEFTFTPSGLNSHSSVYEKERMYDWGKLMDLTKYNKK